MVVKWYINTIINIAVFVIVALAVRACFPEQASLGNQDYETSNQSIVIIPMDGVPAALALDLKRELEQQHKTGVLITTALGKGDEMKISGSEQYNVIYLASLGRDIGRRIGRRNAFLIVLTNEDINYPDSGLRYLFSNHQQGISVVSLARINPLNFGANLNAITMPLAYNKIKERALKIINKAIGYGLYGYRTSSNVNSVMYGPIMGVTDLDRAGTWYE